MLPVIEDELSFAEALLSFKSSDSKVELRRHIRSSAIELGLEALLPDSWVDPQLKTLSCRFCEAEAAVAVVAPEGKSRIHACIRHAVSGRREAGVGAEVKTITHWDPVKHPREGHGHFGHVSHPVGTTILNADGSTTTQLAHTTITVLPYTEGPPETIRSMISDGGGLKKMTSEALTLLAKQISMVVTGNLSGMKTAAAGSADVEAAVLSKLKQLKKDGADLTDHDTFNALINELRTELAPAPATEEAKTLEGKGAAKAAYEEAKHPRDKNGRFTFLGALVHDSKGGGHIVAQSGGKVTVEDHHGQRHTVTAKSVEVAPDGHDKAHHNLSTPEGLHAHLQAEHPGGHAVAPFAAEHHEAHVTMHERAHALGVDGHSHDIKNDPGALHDHLRTHPGGDAVEPHTAAEHAGFHAMHERAHKLGVDDHAHDANGKVIAHPDRAAEEDSQPFTGGEPRSTRATAAAAGESSRHRGYGVTGKRMTTRGDDRAHPMPAGAFPAGDPRNDPEYLKYTEELDKRIKAALDDGLDTQTLNSVTAPDGSLRWTPARAAEHQQIIDDIMANKAAVPTDRQAVMLGGLPGAGKSTFLKAHGDKLGLTLDDHDEPTNAIVINPDEMKSLLLNRLDASGAPMVARVPGLSDGEHAMLIHEESSHLAKLLAARSLAEGKNVVFDITLGDAEKANSKYLSNPELTGAKDLGYSVRAAFVDGDMATSLHRAGLRHKALAKETGQRTFSGRYVPYSHILGEGTRPDDPLTSDGERALSHNRTQFDALVKAGAFDHAIRYNNRTGTFTTDVADSTSA